VFTRARHWSVSWARWLESTTSHPVSLRSVILFIHIYTYRHDLLTRASCVQRECLTLCEVGTIWYLPVRW
jgi:hypothetical protein